MSTGVKIVSCIQILVMMFLVFCNTGFVVNHPINSAGFPCKDHACGCKSEADCKAHCCCPPQGNQSTFQYGVKKQQKDSLQLFISSIKCKSGNDTITFIPANPKYILEDGHIESPLTFLCFLANDTKIHFCEPAIPPPEKPPRRHA